MIYINTDNNVIIMKNHKENISDALCDTYDVLKALRFSGALNEPKDNEGTETTIGDCLENIIETLEDLELIYTGK